MIAFPRLYAIADASFGSPVGIAQKLFDGGARLVQIRSKQIGSGEFLKQVEAVLRFAPTDARIIVNDRADVALLSGAHGVHLGQDDLPAVQARKILGGPLLLGYSTHNMDQARRADSLPLDYIAVGPIYPTSSKQNPDPVVGLEQLAAICKAVRKPVVAIGGITLETAGAVFAAGAQSVAVIGDLLRHDNLVERTKLWVSRCPV